MSVSATDFHNKAISLLNKRVSILLDLNKNILFKESYNGLLEEVGQDYMVINLDNPGFKIVRIIIRSEIVLSIWEYSETFNENWNSQKNKKATQSS